MFAVIESAGNPQHIQLLDSLIKNSPERILAQHTILPENLRLGDITLPYHNFEGAIKQYRTFIQENTFESQKTQLHLQKKDSQKH